MARAGAKVQRWKRAKARMKRLGKIFLAYSMIAFALLLIWCCLLNPSFLPEVQAPVRYGELPLAQFMKLSSTNLNTATPLELMELPGIGEVLAGRIVTYRLQRGGFASVEELREVRGIGEKRLETLRKYVYVE